MKKLTLIFLFIILFLAIVFAVAPDFALAQTNDDCPPGRTCLKNPLDIINVSSPGELIVIVTKGFVAVIGMFAIAFTVFSGFKLIIATNEESIKTARQSITWSVGGFIVCLLSFAIIAGVARMLGFEPSLINLEGDSVGTVLRGPAGSGFLDVVNYVMINFLGLVGFVTTLMIIYYGYRYLTSAGNEEQIEQAKTGLRWSLVGLAVVLLAFTIITAISQLLLVGPGK